MSTSAVAMTTRLQLHFSAADLPDMDTFSKSDPYVVLHAAVPARGPGAAAGALTKGPEIGRTEIVPNNLNPVWARAIEVDYHFEQRQDFIACLYDDDGHKNDADNDHMGDVHFQLAHVVASRRGTRTFDVPPASAAVRRGGKLTIAAVEVNANASDRVELQLGGVALHKVTTFGLPDVYFTLSRRYPTGAVKQLYRSEVVKGSLAPAWKPLPPLSVAALSPADATEPSIQIEVFSEGVMSSTSMGVALVSLAALLAAGGGRALKLGKAHKPATDYGAIVVTRATATHVPTFVEYFGAGGQVQLAIAIDFTGSNGDPRQPASLHYMDPASPNQYVRAIMNVGDILMQYDSDGRVPVTGFGAVVPGSGGNVVSHYFNVTLGPEAEVPGVQGVLDAYGRCLPRLTFSGPTNFAPTVRAVTAAARAAAGAYTVLLIITDGEISDFDATLNAVVDADDAPLSIVIVGVGSGCDFKLMDELDGDDVVLYHSVTNRASRRDLVQFVPMRNYTGATRLELAAEVLREIPAQFSRWAEITGFQMPALSAASNSASVVCCAAAY